MNGTPAADAAGVLVSPNNVYEFEAAHGTVTRHYYKYRNGESTSTNSIATLFAWTGALKKRAELDELSDLYDFAARLEKAALDTIASGIMTGDLARLSTLDNVQTVDSEGFLRAIAARL